MNLFLKEILSQVKRGFVSSQKESIKSLLLQAIVEDSKGLILLILGFNAAFLSGLASIWLLLFEGLNAINHEVVVENVIMGVFMFMISTSLLIGCVYKINRKVDRYKRVVELNKRSNLGTIFAPLIKEIHHEQEKAKKRLGYSEDLSRVEALEFYQ